MLGNAKKDAHGGNVLLGNAKKDAHVGLPRTQASKKSKKDAHGACLGGPNFRPGPGTDNTTLGISAHVAFARSWPAQSPGQAGRTGHGGSALQARSLSTPSERIQRAT